MSDRPEITFNEDGDFVSIWAGQFGSEEEAQAYLEPYYGDGEGEDDEEDDAEHEEDPDEDEADSEDSDDEDEDEMEEIDDRPLSQFAADIGLEHYDDNFRELKFQPGLSDRGEQAFEGHSHAESFQTAAWQAVQRLEIGEFDTLVMLYGYEHTRYPQAGKVPSRVRFVGSFPYVPE